MKWLSVSEEILFLFLLGLDSFSYLSVVCVSCNDHCGPWAGCGLDVPLAGRGWTDAWADAPCKDVGGNPWRGPFRWNSETFWPIFSIWDEAADCGEWEKGPASDACRTAVADSRPFQEPWCPDSTNHYDCHTWPQNCVRRQSLREPSSKVSRWTCCAGQLSCPAEHSHRNQLSNDKIFIEMVILTFQFHFGGDEVRT